MALHVFAGVKGTSRCVKVLSQRAQSIIRDAINAGKYNERVDGQGPPFMAPSDDRADYSNVCSLRVAVAATHNVQWCSFCNEFGGELVLCAGCRIALCRRAPDQPGGCVKWCRQMEDDDFVFHCLFCTRDMNRPSEVVFPFEQRLPRYNNS